MNPKQLIETDWREAAASLGCEVSALKAVCAVESRARGFHPDGSVVTLFEGHVFYKYTAGKFAQSHPKLCYPKWTKQFYGKTVKQEKQRLNQALALDTNAALLSTSWGMFQIMGFNHAHCGFPQVVEFVEAMRVSEKRQLAAFCQFIRSIGAMDALRHKAWERFAKLYNGPGYAKNGYDKKLSAAYQSAEQRYA